MPHSKTATFVAKTEIPNELIDRAMALQEQAPCGGCLWRERGLLINECANGSRRGQRMIIYQALSDIWGCGLSTVREDAHNANDLGDIIDEIPMLFISREQCRCARNESKLRDVDIGTIIKERVEQSDKYGGRLCPVRVWKAQIKAMRNGKKVDSGQDVIGRIEGATSAIATAIKRVNGRKIFAPIMAD